MNKPSLNLLEPTKEDPDMLHNPVPGLKIGEGLAAGSVALRCFVTILQNRLYVCENLAQQRKTK